MVALLRDQLDTTKTQVKLLKEKMDLAFLQMKRAKLDFPTYLLHRNAYLDRQRNFLQLKKDLWLNLFTLHKDFAQLNADVVRNPS